MADPAAQSGGAGRPAGRVAQLHRLREPMLFAMIGVLNTAIDFGVFVLLVRLGVTPLVANVVSFSLGSLNSYVLNGRFTFRPSVADEGSAGVSAAGTARARSWRTVLRFAGMTGLSLLLSQAVLATGLAMHLPPAASKAVAIVCTFAFGFTLSKLYVFRAEPR